MRIKKALIQNFLSINSPEEVPLDKAITILIGRNECGKTNFLRALESFKRGYEYKDEDLCTYSTAKEELEGGSLERGNIPIVTLSFIIEDEDKSKLREIHDKLAHLEELKITKFFNNRYEIETSLPDTSTVELDVAGRIEELSTWVEVKSQIDALRANLDAHTQRLSEFVSSKPQYEQCISDFLELASRNSIEEVEQAFDTLIASLNSLPNQDDPIQNDVAQFSNQLTSLKEALKAELQEKQKAKGDIITQVLDIMPNFIYFTDVDLIHDSVPLSAFRANRQQYKTLDNLFVLAGLDIDKLAEGSPYARRSATEIASTIITGLVNNFWKQERVKVSIGIDGDNLIVFVTDDVGAFDPPSRRSKGFQWFLSFYTNFTAGSKNELKNTILLLDDPGVYLHPLGQEDLKKTLEQLSTSNQLVLATHSPFMIYRDHLERIRIVDKQSDKGGTKLIEKYWVSDFDAIAPLRAALGISLGEFPLVSKRRLIVEGYEDLLYLEAMALYFKRSKRKPVIDLSKILILPVNGADKVPFYTMFLFREGFKLAVLLDYDNKGRRVAKNIIESQLIPNNLVITLDRVDTSGREGIDLETEDLFAPDFYKCAVGEVYRTAIDEGKLNLDDLDSSIVKQTKGYHKLFKDSGLSFDELQVAQQIRIIADRSSCDDKLLGNTTLNNFSKLFEIINEELK